LSTPSMIGLVWPSGIEAVQSAGGFGVRVGPGETQARYRVADVDAVGAWLRSEPHR